MKRADNNIEKNTWIEAVMQSTKGQQPAEVNPFLYTRVKAKLQDDNSVFVPVKWIYAVSACIVILFVLNAGLFLGKASVATKSSIDNMINEYGLQDNAIVSYQ